jgi:ABC-type Zn uptake system ZnuABC Zn-binding protein ZnuA
MMNKTTIRTRVLLAVVAVVVAAPGIIQAQDRLRVVTTLPDLRSITEMIGGDRVDAFAIATGYQNPHFVDPKPSYIRRLATADIFITVGLDLESGWVPPVINSARNRRILVGGEGYVDASVGVPLLQQPASASREQGDIHIYGNPHYWLDPIRGKAIALNIYESLTRLRPSDREYFAGNLQQFNDSIDESLATLMTQIAPYAGAKIVAYHNEWPYFEERFGMNIVDFLEPKPGIPPSPSQLAKVIRLMQSEGIRIIITSPYFKKDAAELVARKTDAMVVTLGTSVGATDGIDTYLDLFRYNVSALVAAFEQTGYKGQTSP